MDRLPKQYRWLPAVIALAYLVIAGAYIFFSDYLVDLMTDDPDVISRIQTYKGIGFVVVMAVGLFLALHYTCRRFAGHQQDLLNAYEQSRRLAEQRRELVSELDHRVRNNLASLQALVRIYSAAFPTHDQFVQWLGGKLRAMSVAHDVSREARESTLKLNRLVNELLTHSLAGGAERIETEGPDVDLPPRFAQPLAIAIQELADRSRRDGALRAETGRVRLHWQTRNGDGRPTIDLRWQDIGRGADGPHDGGLELIRGLVEHEMSGRCDFDNVEEGFTCKLSFNLGNPGPVAPAA